MTIPYVNEVSSFSGVVSIVQLSMQERAINYYAWLSPYYKELSMHFIQGCPLLAVFTAISL